MADPSIDPRDLARLTTVQNELEAQVLEGLLADRGIRCSLRIWRSLAYDGIFEAQKGYAEVKVFKDDLERAKEVLDDFERQLAGKDEAASGDPMLPDLEE